MMLTSLWVKTGGFGYIVHILRDNTPHMGAEEDDYANYSSDLVMGMPKYCMQSCKQ
jgi:hypothetical protein